VTVPDIGPADHRYLTVFILTCLCLAALGSSAAFATQSGWDAAYGPNASEDVPEWTPPPPPPGTEELTPKAYLLMWNGMETIPGDATDAVSGNYSKKEFLKVLAARRDSPETTPPQTQVVWNTATESTFPNTSPQNSRFPPGTSRRNEFLIKDAYLRIAQVTPSTHLYSHDSSELLVRRDGGLLTAGDYRVEPPTADLSVDDVSDPDVVDVRVEFELKNTSTSRIRVFETTPDAQGEKTPITSESTNATGGNYVTYAGLSPRAPDNTAGVLARQNVSAAFIKTVEHLRCNDPQNTVTVTDSRTVHLNDPQVDIRYRPGPETSYIEVEDSQGWSSITVGPTSNQSVVSDHYAFYTKRAQAWDTMRVATAGGTSDPKRHPFTPVETHALPAYNGSYISNPPSNLERITRRSETVGGHQPPFQPQPYHVNVSSGTDTGYQPLERIVVAVDAQGDSPALVEPSEASSETDIVLRPYVYRGRIGGGITKLSPTKRVNISMEASPVYGDNSSMGPEYYAVTVWVTEAATGEPIMTRGSNRTIRLSGGDTIESNESGIGTFKAPPGRYGAVGLHAEFKPRSPFAGETHYTKAFDSTNAVSPGRALFRAGRTVGGALVLLTMAVVPGLAIVGTVFFLLRLQQE